MNNTTSIPLFEDETVSVWPDFESKTGRAVLVQRVGALALNLEPTSAWGSRIRKYSLALTRNRCFVHPERTAARYAWKPKFPGEPLPVCAECGDGSPASANVIFQTRAALIREHKL